MSKKLLKVDIQQEWLSLNDELNKHNYLYHAIDSPEISDFQYDKMKKRLIYLEKEFPELNTQNSIIDKVGYLPSANFDKIKHILVRHEQGAGHAAEGYARSSGKPGVVLVTSGPGATNVVTALTDAYMDSIPVSYTHLTLPTKA